LAIYTKLELIKDFKMSKNDPNIDMFDKMIYGERVDEIVEFAPGTSARRRRRS
jgi:hypothetical protein